MKDVHIVGKKLARNGLKTATSLYVSFPIRLYFIDHITYSDGELEEVINQLVQDPELKIDLSVEANVTIGRDTR